MTIMRNESLKPEGNLLAYVTSSPLLVPLRDEAWRQSNLLVAMGFNASAHQKREVVNVIQNALDMRCLSENELASANMI